VNVNPSLHQINIKNVRKVNALSFNFQKSFPYKVKLISKIMKGEARS